MKTRLYAAYGSNLNRGDWKRWCKEHACDAESIQPVGTAWLPDFELVFDKESRIRKCGVLNLRERKGGLVQVGLFSCTDDGHSALRDKEGANAGTPQCYKEIKATVLTEDGKAVEVFTFRVPDTSKFVLPSEDYVDIVRQGCADYDFDPTPLNAAACDSPQVLPLNALFVYGTLMRQQPRFQQLRQYGISCALLAQCHGTLLDCGEYPGMIGGDSIVRGELIRLDRFEEAIAELDDIEGFEGFGSPNSLFQRRLVSVDMGDGHMRLAWTYFLCEEGEHPVIPSGDWREHTGVKRQFFDDLVSRHVGERERDVALKLSARTPFDAEDAVRARAMLPLSRALSEGLLSERELAQVTDMWAITT